MNWFDGREGCGSGSPGVSWGVASALGSATGAASVTGAASATGAVPDRAVLGVVDLSPDGHLEAHVRATRAGPVARASGHAALGRVARGTSDGEEGVHRARGEHHDVSAVSPVAATQSEVEPWWEVDLGSAHLLDGLNLYNRTDCCGAQLAGFDILIGDDPFGAVSLADARAAATWCSASTMATTPTRR